MAEEDRTGPQTYGTLPPEDALSLLGNEVRAGVLWALSEARAGAGEPPALSFSELRERVAPEMDSSQFNYHLQQLVGTFLERRGGDTAQLVEDVVDDDAVGYALRPEGTTLTRTIRAGSVVGDAEIPAFEMDRECYHCGSRLEAQYRHWLFRVQCPGCDYLYDYNLTPPGVVVGDREGVLARVAEYNRHVRLGFARGTCPLCADRVSAAFVDPADTNYPRRDRREAFVHRVCAHCGNVDWLTVGELFLREPALVAFCHDHGLDVTRTPLWDLEFAMTDRHVDVRNRDPWTVAFELSLGDETLELVLDEDVSLVAEHRY